MPRSKDSEVRLVLPSHVKLTDAQLHAAIAAASCVVDRMVGCGPTDDCLKQVEIYLAAHFAAVTDNSLSISSETDPCSGGSAKYGFKFGEGVMGTPYGQMANTLSGGCLVEIDKQPANIFAIGSH